MLGKIGTLSNSDGKNRYSCIQTGFEKKTTLSELSVRHVLSHEERRDVSVSPRSK